ncbi:GNAT family N-acetyltransferase [Devosia sp. XJ19-1]|uniref:GNAT family N-acetyltransferase n=1 Tax=Devosia ureilytica TaxID=2952754 RepID=A0A9Q4AN06_9HYPH|nr:GNAT family N-acetyltransferase [Devosia ureilytica]MCP8883046.1 GNAT family N-acetyltransferase [Devosia ureilytica]MCP8886586.1 GNAT family N-acetyltransferase [Devosia ureilytica]
MIQFRDVAWRAMSGYDFEAVFAIANQVHPGFFEAETVLAEKFALYRNGCYLLEIGERPAGYVLSHPWTRGCLPALNALLGEIPADADTYYIHDLALLPLTRGVGAAGQIMAALTKHARVMGFPTMSLVAVNGSVAFWEKQGFVREERPELAEKLAAYEAAACYMIKELNTA